MGTILLSVLNGHWRYAHINSVRGDGINPGLLGLRGTVSEDAVRLAMYRIEEKASRARPRKPRKSPRRENRQASSWQRSPKFPPQNPG
jgi:hypothetical protein